jgi:hypothetical protein
MMIRETMVLMRANFLKKVNTKNLIFLLCLFSICMMSCRENKHKVDTGDVKVEGVKVIRFEQDLFAVNPGNYKEELHALKRKYPFFMETYMKDIMNNFDQQSDSVADEKLREFIVHPSIRGLNGEVQKLFGDMSPYEKELEEALVYYKFHFPSKPVPGFISYISEFGPSNVIIDTLIGIGLDKYLGEDYKYYPSLFPIFIVRKLRKEYIVPNAMYAIGNSSFPEDMEDKSFLNKIIYQGKMLYFLDAMLPDTPDSLKIGLSGKQLEWCSANEDLIWKHAVETKLLFSTDPVRYRAYLVDAPFTSAPNIPTDASPMIGIWLGWQIVKKYMEENPTMSLTDLMKQKDPQEMLNKSKYKPVE